VLLNLSYHMEITGPLRNDYISILIKLRARRGAYDWKTKKQANTWKEL